MNDRKESKEVPFFARFLEGQNFPQVQTDLKAGPSHIPPAHTMKYPSDGDDNPPDLSV